MTVNGVKKTGRNMSAVINWTNNGYNNETPFFVWLGTDSEFAAAVSSYLESGKTEDLVNRLHLEGSRNINACHLHGL